jgi:hypothetical protein
MQIEKLAGFNRIYQAECFPNEFLSMVGKNRGEGRRYLQWLYTWLKVLDEYGMSALALQQFEHLQGTENPHLYAIRHPRSQINERYLYLYADDETVVLLTAFKEKDAADYNSAILRANNIYARLIVEEEDES